MSWPLEEVRDQLLRAGVPPRFARRYVMELREHLADLTERERKAGLDAAAAGARARELLGTDTQLAQAMIDTAPRALAARAPWAVFVLLPLVTLLAVIAGVVASMFHLLEPVGGPGGVPNAYNGIVAIASFFTSYMLAPAIAAVSMVVSLRQRLSSPWVWIGFGLVAVVSGLFGFQMNVYSAFAGHPGGTTFSVVRVVWVDGHRSTIATLSLAAMRATVLFSIAGLVFHCLRRRREATRARLLNT